VTRFDIGVVAVTFVALAVAAIIRNIVVPAVRLRVARQRLAANPSLQQPDVAPLRAEVRELEQRNSELESKLAQRQLMNDPRMDARDRTR
jgi:hypothetical protein